MTTMTPSATTAPLVIGIPSKGRLQENTAKFFARAGLHVVQGRGARDYRGSLKELAGVEIAFLSASEIVRELAAGNLHFGVTGEDLIRESIADADDRVELLSPLGFGHANVVVAVPGLDRRAHHGGPGRRGCRLPLAASGPAHARCDKVHQLDTPLLCRKRRQRLSHRRISWRNRRGSGGGSG
jgi:hypothetical protein